MDDNGDKDNGGKSDDPKLSEENSEDEQTFSGKVDQGKESSPEDCKGRNPQKIVRKLVQKTNLQLKQIGVEHLPG